MSNTIKWMQIIGWRWRCRYSTTWIRFCSLWCESQHTHSHTHARITRASVFPSYFEAFPATRGEKNIRASSISWRDLIKMIGVSHVINVLIRLVWRVVVMAGHTHTLNVDEFCASMETMIHIYKRVGTGDKHKHIWLISMHDLYFMSFIFFSSLDSPTSHLPCLSLSPFFSSSSYSWDVSTLIAYCVLTSNIFMDFNANVIQSSAMHEYLYRLRTSFTFG